MKGLLNVLPKSRWERALFALILTWVLVASVSLAWRDAQTYDEAIHLTAGYSYITTHDYRLNPEHPPLLKELSAVPLLFLNVKNVHTLDGWQQGDGWKAGYDFVYRSQTSPRVILFFGRMATIGFTLTLLITTYCIASFMTSRKIGLLAMGFLAFTPNILAHGHLVTTDVAASLGIMITLGATIFYIQRPSAKRLTLLGLGLGFALSTKYSTILLLPLVVASLLYSILVFESKAGITLSHKFWRLCIAVSSVLCIAAGVLFITYGFEVVKPAVFAFSKYELTTTNSLVASIAHVPVPMYSYARGFDFVFNHSNDGGNGPSFLLGNYSHGGWWFYFVVAFFIKNSIVVISLCFLLIFAALRSIFIRVKGHTLLNSPTKKQFYVVLLASFMGLYITASFATTINIGWRHMLPLYPVLYILLAIVYFEWLKKNPKPWLAYGLVAVLFAYQAVSVVTHMPYMLSYSNSLFPVITSDFRPRLTDSNLDWGQDVYALLGYAKHDQQHRYKYDVVTNADLQRLGESSNLSTLRESFNTKTCHADDSDYLVVSYGALYAQDSLYSCLRGAHPSATIGASMLVYKNKSI
jgi:hypothetical protein